MILGGTREASLLASAVAEASLRATLSYAGRVERPRRQPVETRVGGFGGPEGLAAWVKENAITHIIDATHPFAAEMSWNAAGAAKQTATPLIALTRPAWRKQPGDQWTDVADLAAAAAVLQGPPRRVMLAIGRGGIEAFQSAPNNFYLLRFVDPPSAPLALPDAKVIVSRGPFDRAGDMAIMQAHRIDLVVAKNAGGPGAVAKLEAARALGLPVVMVARPPMPPRVEATAVADVLAWVARTS